jgi:hypothetical protein
VLTAEDGCKSCGGVGFLDGLADVYAGLLPGEIVPQSGGFFPDRRP